MALHFKSTGIDYDDLDSGGAITTTMGDYERGTHTPSLMAGSASWANTQYIRIGDLVYVCGEAYTPNSTFYTSASTASMTMPFIAVASRCMGAAMTNKVDFSGDWMTAYMGNNANTAYYHGQYNSKSSSWVSPKGNNFASTANWYTGWVYTSDS